MNLTGRQLFELAYGVFSGLFLGIFSLEFQSRQIAEEAGTTDFDIPDITNCVEAQTALAQLQAVYDNVQRLVHLYTDRATRLFIYASLLGVSAAAIAAAGAAAIWGGVSTPGGIAAIAAAAAMFIAANFLFGRGMAWQDRADSMVVRLNELGEKKKTLEALVETLCNPTPSVVPDVGGTLVDPVTPSLNE